MILRFFSSFVVFAVLSCVCFFLKFHMKLLGALSYFFGHLINSRGWVWLANANGKFRTIYQPILDGRRPSTLSTSSSSLLISAVLLSFTHTLSLLLCASITHGAGLLPLSPFLLPLRDPLLLMYSDTYTCTCSHTKRTKHPFCFCCFSRWSVCVGIYTHTLALSLWLSLL